MHSSGVLLDGPARDGWRLRPLAALASCLDFCPQGFSELMGWRRVVWLELSLHPTMSGVDECGGDRHALERPNGSA